MKTEKYANKRMCFLVIISLKAREGYSRQMAVKYSSTTGGVVLIKWFIMLQA